MPRTHACPSCQQTLEVSNELIGKHVRCPTCDTTFRADWSTLGPAEDSDEPVSETDHERRERLIGQITSPEPGWCSTKAVATGTMILLGFCIVCDVVMACAAGLQYALLVLLTSSSGDLSSTTWSGRERSLSVTITFCEDDRLLYVRGHGDPAIGTWRLDQKKLSYQIENGHQFVGSLQGDQLIGRTTDGNGRAWSTVLERGLGSGKQNWSGELLWVSFAALRNLSVLPAGTLFLVWFYQAHRNLLALGNRTLRFGSGWAIGGWFVPVLNLFRPHQVAQEIWRRSDPAGFDSPLEMSARSNLIRLWWALWLASEIIGIFALPLSAGTLSPHVSQDLWATGAIGCTLNAFCAICAILMVRQIQQRQSARLTALDAATPSSTD